MTNTIHYTSCPVCGSADLKDVLRAKDHTVTGETFLIAECNNCSLRFTQDVPDAVSISPYYNSEDYISHSNTSRGLINRVYQTVRRTTLRKKRKLVEKTTGVKKGNLLDVGSGTGSFVNEMKKEGWVVTGLEPDPGARELASKTYGISLSDSKELNRMAAGSFDAITLWHVLEHVHELHAYIRQLRSILKDTGYLFVAVPNYTSLDAAVYEGNWAAYDVPRHLYHFSPRSMQVLMEQNGFTIRQYKPMWYDSFYISLLSSRYKSGKSNLIAASVNGIRSNLKALGDVKKCSSVIYVISK